MLTRFIATILLCVFAAKALAWESSDCCSDANSCEPLTDSYESSKVCCDSDWYQPWNYWGWDNYLGDVIFSSGYREDHLSWSIAGPSDTPNILSELQWNNLQIWEIKGQLEFLLYKRIYIRGYADYGRIFDGHNRDSDYAGNNKSHEFSRSKATADRGEVFDFSGGMGYQFYFGDCFGLLETDLTFTPIAGYSYHEQHIQDRHGVQLIDRVFNEAGEEIPLGLLGPFPGLHSKYRAKWKGPWAGFDTCYQICCNWELFGSFEYHWAHYRGIGHWNLRKDFIKDFRQKAKDGHGYLFQVGTSYDFWRAGFVRLTFNYQWMKSGSGSDRTFFITGPMETRFNGATWHTWSILADLGWTF